MRTQRRKIFLSILVTILIMSTLLLFVGCKGNSLGKPHPLVGEWTQTDPSHHSPDMESSFVIEQKKGKLYVTKEPDHTPGFMEQNPIKYDKDSDMYFFSIFEIIIIDQDTIQYAGIKYHRIKRK